MPYIYITYAKHIQIPQRSLPRIEHNSDTSEGSISNSGGSEEEEDIDNEDEDNIQRQIPLHMGLSEVEINSGGCLEYAYAEHIQSTLRDYGALISSNGKRQVIVQEAIDHIMIPEYPATAETGIAHFINVTNPLLSIDADKETVRKVIKQYMSKVSIAYTHRILYLYIL